MRKKILKGIEAFNECWFRTCYYHQLIAGLSYYGVPAEYTILNYTADITCDKARGEIGRASCRERVLAGV